MRILITGALGQLGKALERELDHHELALVDLPETDITESSAAFSVVSQSRAEVVIHCAAYTDVDACARDPELAHRVNALGTQNMALACQRFGADMVHISTNEVFAGLETAGYEEWMPLDPINPYGRSKAAAEVHVRDLLDRFYIVRTAWLFAPGGRNFIHAILKRARETGMVRVVADEVGNPTYARDLAAAIGQVIETKQYGIYHFTNSGACSRWQFAAEILRLAGLDHVSNVPILSREYRRASTPPLFGALRNIAGATIGITLRPWQDALSDYFEEHIHSGQAPDASRSHPLTGGNAHNA